MFDPSIQKDAIDLGVTTYSSLVIWMGLSIAISAFFKAYLWRKWLDPNCWFNWFSYVAFAVMYALMAISMPESPHKTFWVILFLFFGGYGWLKSRYWAYLGNPQASETANDDSFGGPFRPA